MPVSDRAREGVCSLSSELQLPFCRACFSRLQQAEIRSGAKGNKDPLPNDEEAAFGSGPSPQAHTSKLISYRTLRSPVSCILFPGPALTAPDFTGKPLAAVRATWMGCDPPRACPHIQSHRGRAPPLSSPSHRPLQGQVSRGQSSWAGGGETRILGPLLALGLYLNEACFLAGEMGATVPAPEPSHSLAKG